MRLTLLFLFLLLAPIPANPQAGKSAREMTLGEVRALLVGKKVVVNPGPYFRDKYLLYWAYASKEGDAYRESRDLDRHLPASYQNQEADVLAVQLNYLKRREVGRPNALGEVTSEDTVVNPYCDVVVKFGDGTVAMTTSYPSLLLDEMAGAFKLAEKRRSRAQALTSQLPSIVGKTVYASAYSSLHPVTATASDLLEDYRRTRLFYSAIPRLRPLTITVAKYDEEHDAVILKLKDEAGKEYLAASTVTRTDEKADFLERVVGSTPAALNSKLPNLSPREMEAAREGSIFRGMSLTALYHALGFPEKKNNWGAGGQQLIYAGGAVLVYLDSAERVRDWQTLSR
jgi:hypothetical protein